MKQLSSYDILAEDPIISSQQYGIFSYILPDPTKNELHRPMIKFRGSYRTREECKHNAERLSKLDEHKYVNIYEIALGKWGSLLTQEELENEEIDIEYSNELMQEMMQGYRDQKDKVDTEYSQRKDHRLEQLKFDSSKEGQKYLNSMEENIVSVKDRLEKYKEDLELNIENMVYVEKRLKYNQDLGEKLAEIAVSKDHALKENDLFVQENIIEIDREIANLEARIATLKEKKVVTEKISIEGRIKNNLELINYSKDNKIYLQDKIDTLRESIKNTQTAIENRESKHALIEASKNMKY
jgi:hypothetical protein